MIERVLAIETSCDDTSVAVVRHDGWVESVVSADQDLYHKPFGGVVPEIASRNHTLQLLPTLELALERSGRGWPDIGGIAVTSRPGLIGSLMVGVVTAKTLAAALEKPFIGVNHLEAHLLAPFLKDAESAPPADFAPPYLALAISGGHTQIYSVKAFGEYQVLGRTIDDAAGEAFDKFAKMIGLGFPGGAKVDRLAKQGDPKAYAFPRPFLEDARLDFSFSGLKTAGLRVLQKMTPEEIESRKADLCASFQEAIVDCLIGKFDQALKVHKASRVVLTGGVSANSRLREVAETWAARRRVQLVVPPLRYCTDNAAMVGFAGILRLNQGERSDQSLAPLAQSEF
jgi:N6-L-threonylcarbamoyladenine synthase